MMRYVNKEGVPLSGHLQRYHKPLEGFITGNTIGFKTREDSREILLQPFNVQRRFTRKVEEDSLPRPVVIGQGEIVLK